MNRNWSTILLSVVCFILLLDRACNLQDMETNQTRIKGLESKLRATELQRDKQLSDIDSLQSLLMIQQRIDTIIHTKYVQKKAFVRSLPADSLIIYIRSKL